MIVDAELRTKASKLNLDYFKQGRIVVLKDHWNIVKGIRSKLDFRRF